MSSHDIYPRHKLSHFFSDSVTLYGWPLQPPLLILNNKIQSTILPMVVMTVVEKKKAPENFHCVPALWGTNLMMLRVMASQSACVMLYLSMKPLSSISKFSNSRISFSDSKESNMAAPIKR